MVLTGWVTLFITGVEEGMVVTGTSGGSFFTFAGDEGHKGVDAG